MEIFHKLACSLGVANDLKLRSKHYSLVHNIAVDSLHHTILKTFLHNIQIFRNVWQLKHPIAKSIEHKTSEPAVIIACICYMLLLTMMR